MATGYLAMRRVDKRLGTFRLGVSIETGGARSQNQTSPAQTRFIWASSYSAELQSSAELLSILLSQLSPLRSPHLLISPLLSALAAKTLACGALGCWVPVGSEGGFLRGEEGRIAKRRWKVGEEDHVCLGKKSFREGACEDCGVALVSPTSPRD
ncbi:uncharacterized protein [Physcomitrium patens]|uniref:uncharacterized protein n=1 Tax=Physcomitrium patens TaxID=3218 RepID=UPI00016202AA